MGTHTHLDADADINIDKHSVSDDHLDADVDPNSHLDPDSHADTNANRYPLATQSLAKRAYSTQPAQRFDTLDHASTLLARQRGP